MLAMLQKTFFISYFRPMTISRSVNGVNVFTVNDGTSTCTDRGV